MGGVRYSVSEMMMVKGLKRRGKNRCAAPEWKVERQGTRKVKLLRLRRACSPRDSEASCRFNESH